MLGLCALAALRIVWSIVGELRQPPESNSVEAVIARFEPLRRLLPEGVVTGFVVDERHADVNLVPSAERFRLAKYALSPRVVEDSRTMPWSSSTRMSLRRRRSPATADGLLSPISTMG